MSSLKRRGRCSKQRLLAALTLEEPDRVPVIPVMPGRIFKDVYGLDWSRELYYKKMLDLGFDPFIGVGLGTPVAAEGVKLDERILREGDRGKTIERTFHTPSRDLKEVYFFSTAPEQTVADEHLLTYPGFKEFMVKTIEDVEGLREMLPDPRERDTADLEKTLIEYGDKSLVVAGLSGIFTSIAHVRGYKQMVRDVYTDPTVLRKLLDLYLKLGLETIRVYGHLGVETIYINGNFSSMSLISPMIFKKYVYPYEKQFCQEAHKNHILVRYHMDGRCSAALEMLAEMGIDQVDTLDPPTLGGDITIGEAKRRVGGKICLLGNVDPVSVIRMGNPQDILKKARECIADAAPGGGFILSSADTLAPGTKPENLAALAEAAHTYGRYR